MIHAIIHNETWVCLLGGRKYIAIITEMVDVPSFAVHSNSYLTFSYQEQGKFGIKCKHRFFFSPI